MKSYPAVKIGRLGTQRMCSGQGLARDIIDYIKVLFTNGNRTGCRFLTVDAHRDAVGFTRNAASAILQIWMWTRIHD